MVQEYQSPVRVYKYPFEMVMAAYEKRFPSCKMIPVVVGCEITSDEQAEDDSYRITERRCQLNVDAPRLLKRMVGVDYIYFIQKNHVHWKNRTLDITAHNETFSNRVLINEFCQYKVHPENAEWTTFEQSATMEIKSFFGFESSVEKLAMKQYTANIKKGKEIIEYYLNELIESGITEIPTWRETNSSRKSSTHSDKLAATGFVKLNVDEEEDEDERSRSSSTFSSDPEIELGETSSGVDRIAGGADDDKLDEEYIEHRLGLLQPMEESKLIQLRKWLSDTHSGKLPRDEHILRFLRARDFHFDKAKEFLCQSLSWRKQHQIDRLLETWSTPMLLKENYSGCWHHHDNEGRPLYVLRIGQMDTKGLLKGLGEDQILRHVLFIMEEGLKKCEESSNSLKKPLSNSSDKTEASEKCIDRRVQSSWSCIVDLEGLTMRHLWRPGIQALLRIIEVIEANYPETMGLLLIVRAPRVFPVIWTLISPFIDEKTRSKFMMYSGTDYMGPGGLIDYIPEEYIPDFLGGPCHCDMPIGKVVPKNLYRAEWDKIDGSTSLWGTSIYKTANVFKGAPHEVLVDVPEKDCVVTWDFDILKCDASFTVYYSCVPLVAACEIEPKESITSIATTAAAPAVNTQTVNFNHDNVTSTDDYYAILTKQLVEGVDYTAVVDSHLHKEGESVQGSHIAKKPGSYILQWKFGGISPSSSTLPVVPDVLYQVTHSVKTKLIYYHELLYAEDFRGSMSSLKSSQSGFSCLSQATQSSGSASFVSR